MPNKSLQLIWVNYDIHRSSTRQLIFLSSNACHTDLFPSFGSIGFLGSLNGLSELIELDQTWGNFGIVFHDGIELLSSFIQPCAETFVPYFLAVSWVGSWQEALQFSQLVKPSIGEGQGVVNVDILRGLSYHQQVLYVEWVFEVFFLALRLIVHQPDDSQIISVVFTLHERFHSIRDFHVIEVSNT